MHLPVSLAMTTASLVALASGWIGCRTGAAFTGSLTLGCALGTGLVLALLST